MAFHSFTAHADLVTVSTGCRSNFIFDGDLVDGAIPLSFNKTTATGYEIRNYDGDIVKSGALAGGAPPRITDADLTWRGRGPYGWYRGYLTGPAVANWGTAYGDFTFYRVSDSDLFPDNPTPATAGTGTNGADEIARGVMGLGPERVNAQVANIYPFAGVLQATAAAATSVTVAPGNLGNGNAVKLLVAHLFVGDPSELATPTQSGTAVTWALEARATNGTVTASMWSGVFTGAINPGTVTFSSGTKAGTHRLYSMTVRDGDWAQARTAATATGTGTTASVDLVSQGFPAGRQEAVFGFVATSTGVTFAPWSTGMLTGAWDLSDDGNQPAAPNSVISAATGIFGDSDARTVTAAWDTSCDFAMVAVPVCAVGHTSTAPVASTALSKTWWTDYALPARPRRSIVLFADGPGQRYNLIPSVLAPYAANDVVFSPYNEPIFTRSVADYINLELAPFYEEAKAADPDVTILGGSPVTFNDASIGWLNEAIGAGMLDHCDDVDVHGYNAFNGDLALARYTLENLFALLEANDFTGDVWQTEQGFGWQYLGQTWPRYAGRWTALMWFMCELYGIPVERNHYWYDTQHGFDNFPMWWINSTGPGPQALPVRTMVAEIGNRTLEAQLDFGDAANLYAGGTWVGDDGSSTVGFLAQSVGQPPVRFLVGTGPVEVVDCWGNVETVEPLQRVITVEASEMPTWIRVPAGRSCTLIPAEWDWGTNHAAGLTATASFTGAVSIARVTDGVFQNQYVNSSSSLTNAAAPFSDTVASSFPATITIPLGSLQPVGRVAVTCPPPWQGLTSFIDFDIEYQNADDTWTVAETFDAPESTSFEFVSIGRCTSETFWSQRNAFVWESSTPVQAKGIRCTVRSTSDGPFENAVWTNNGQVTPGQKVMVQEIQVWSEPAPEPIVDDRDRFNLTVTCSG